MTIEMPNPNRVDGVQLDVSLSVPLDDEVALLLDAVLGQISLHMDELRFRTIEALRIP